MFAFTLQGQKHCPYRATFKNAVFMRPGRDYCKSETFSWLKYFSCAFRMQAKSPWPTWTRYAMPMDEHQPRI